MKSELALIVMLAVAAASQPPAEETSACAITYVANAGVLFESDGRKFLIDAPTREGIPPYATPDAEQRRKLEGALPPFDNVSAILVTHWHEDHLSAAAAAAHLRSSPATQLVSSQEVVERVRAAGAAPLDADRLLQVTPDAGNSQRVSIGGVAVHVLRIRHNPTRPARYPEQHVGFLIEGCRTVLHTGDADPKEDNFTVLKSLPRIDTALLPFWYVSDDRSRQFVAKSIAPSRILAIHIPPQDAADVTTKTTTVANATALTVPGARIRLIP